VELFKVDAGDYIPRSSLNPSP